MANRNRQRETGEKRLKQRINEWEKKGERNGAFHKPGSTKK